MLEHAVVGKQPSLSPRSTAKREALPPTAIGDGHTVALVSRGEFNIVIAGLAVAAGVHPDLGPLAAAYILTLAAFGPLAARLVQPFVTAIAKRA